MSTLTTLLSLIKPAGADNVDITQINSNMDTIDAKLGVLGKSARAICTASVTTNSSGAFVDVTGATITIDAISTNDVFLVVCSIDVSVDIAAGNFAVIGLSVDGANQASNINTDLVRTHRLGGMQQWLITGLAAGNHVFKLQHKLDVAAGGGTYTIYATNTTITVIRLKN